MQPIIMQTDSAGQPAVFSWQRKYPFGHTGHPETLYIESIVDTWREAGECWDGELPKTYYLVQTENGAHYELYCDSEGKWVLYRIMD